MILSLTKKVLTFRSDQTGSLSVEAVFAFPLLILAATATYTFFDVYKSQNNSLRANFTISDMLSRETGYVDQAYLNGLTKVYRHLTGADPARSWIRISVVQCIDDCADDNTRTLSLDWSHASGGASGLTADDFALYNAYIPLLAQSDRLILVETSMHYEPPFARTFTSFKARELANHVVTRPRFAAQLKWDSDA